MNAAQSTQLTAAIERASKSGIRILGTGRRKSDGARLIVVTSSRSQVQAWCVAVEGGHLACPCPAGQVGRLCQHRGLAYTFLLAEANAARAAESSAAEREVKRTPRNAEATVRGFNDTRGFSIFK